MSPGCDMHTSDVMGNPLVFGQETKVKLASKNFT